MKHDAEREELVVVRDFMVQHIPNIVQSGWAITVAIILPPLYLYLAILGVVRMAQPVPPFGMRFPLNGVVLPVGWKVPLIVILVIVYGMLYIRTCLGTLRSLKHGPPLKPGPQADFSKLAIAAHIA